MPLLFPSQTCDQNRLIRLEELLQRFHRRKRLRRNPLQCRILSSMMNQQTSNMADSNETLANLPTLAFGEKE